MSNYPTVLTQKLLDNNVDISIATIEQDISDTLAEILIQETKVTAQQAILDCPTSTQMERKMAAFRQDGAIDGKTRRLAFVKFLKMLKRGKEEGLPNDN